MTKLASVRPRRRLLPACGLSIALVLGPAPVARAHPLGLGALLVVERDDGVFDVSLRLSPDEAGVARPEIVPGAGCVSSGPSRAGRDGDTLTRALRMRCEGHGALEIAGLAGSDVRVLATVRRRGAPERRSVIEPDAAHLDLERRDAALGSSSSFTDMVALGAEHVALGIDHLLFVLGLLLLARTPRALVLAITGFTLGHSVTLALATLDVVQAPRAPVEISIALSLVLVALEARRREHAETLAVRRPWLVAGSFGLVHGLGFAGALGGLGLREGRLAESLLGFNLGVELGQLAFVGLVLGVARALSTQGRTTKARSLAAHAIGVAGVYLALDRAATAWLGV